MSSSVFRKKWQLDYIDKVDSTNTYLISKLNNDIHEIKQKKKSLTLTNLPYYILIASTQYNGRGRYGKFWQSKPGESLLYSTSVTINSTVNNLSSLSLIAGLTLISILRCYVSTVKSQNITLKWPNDLLFDKRKLAGILIEVASIHGKNIVLVIGLGMNLILFDKNHKEQNFFCSLPIASLDEMLVNKKSVIEVTNHIILYWNIELIKAIKTFEKFGFAPFRYEWWQNYEYANKAVNLYDCNEQLIINGISVGINNEGYLLIKKNDTIYTITNDNFSLRVSL